MTSLLLRALALGELCSIIFLTSLLWGLNKPRLSNDARAVLLTMAWVVVAFGAGIVVNHLTGTPPSPGLIVIVALLAPLPVVQIIAAGREIHSRR